MIGATVILDAELLRGLFVSIFFASLDLLSVISSFEHIDL
jgi:hypothetical protein